MLRVHVWVQLWFFCRNLVRGPIPQGSGLSYLFVFCLQNQTHGFDNLAYERGSQSELSPPAPACSSATFRLPGLGPEPGAEAVGSKISGLPGVLSVFCPSRHVVQVDYDASIITERDLVREVQNMGLDVDPRRWRDVSSDWSAQTVALCIAGMTCSSCSSSIQERLSQMGGVEAIAVSLSAGTATVTFDPRLTEAERLRAAIEDMGFEASLQGSARWFQADRFC